MSLQLVGVNPYSRPGIGTLPSAMDVETDAVISALTDNIDLIVSQFGVMVTPAQNLKAALSCMADFSTLILLPGTYQLNDLLILDRGCTLRGLGDVTIQLGIGARIILLGDYCRLTELTVVKRDRDLDCAVLAVGHHCKVSDVLCIGATQYAIRVTGAHCQVNGAWVMQDVAHVAETDVDVYIDDVAVYATVLGTSWSVTRGKSVSYKNLTNASEAANGPASIIEVR